ncbi:hypothetical protein [Candidatus Villigracilis affinis]|uniref:hypothetical protein n=1 Tax=Candidatus Villigracilis affinis TaxID=3140682 RepID=UPI001D382768|nr:hypothetical protein [Anaerolineales bacterium]MBL0347279.1 hypothetical protein [Anaerolineales bacterium]
MLAPFTYQRTVSVKAAPNQGVSHGISRVFSAALVNKQFCDLLLEDPNTALNKGYLGEGFPLSKEERDLIVSIRATSLSDLAKQVSRSLSNNY